MTEVCVWLAKMKGSFKSGWIILAVYASKQKRCSAAIACIATGRRSAGSTTALCLREVGLSYLPDDIKRPAENDKIRELVIPFDYANAVWLPRAIQDTADFRKKQR